MSKIGVSLSINIGVQKLPIFDFFDDFNGEYLRNETWYGQSGMVLEMETTKGPLQYPKMSWTLVHERQK